MSIKFLAKSKANNEPYRSSDQTLSYNPESLSEGKQFLGHKITEGKNFSTTNSCPIDGAEMSFSKLVTSTASYDGEFSNADKTREFTEEAELLSEMYLATSVGIR